MMALVGDIRRTRGTGSRPRWLAATHRWQARYTGPDGRQRSVYSYLAGPAGEKEAAKKRDDALAALSLNVDPSAMPLADWLDRYLARRMTLAPESRARYARYVKAVRASEARDERGRRVGDKPIAKVTTDDLETLYLERQAAGVAPKGVADLHAFIRGALAKAEATGKVMRNVATGAERPTVRRQAPVTLTRVELRRLLDAATGTPHEAYVTLLATTGLRSGEVLDLRWSAIRDGRLVLADPEKGGVPRTILLAPRAIRSLAAHRARVAAVRLKRAGAWEDEDRVFPGTWGSEADRSAMRDRLAATAREAGVRHVTPRLLRHTVATLLLEDGVPMKVVQELLGHRSYRTTSDVYSHVSQTMLERAVEAMDRVVGE